MAAKEWKESFATYLKRNYKEGEKVVFNKTSEEILKKFVIHAQEVLKIFIGNRDAFLQHFLIMS